MDQRYHHRAEATKKQILKRNLVEDSEQQIKEYLSEQYN